MRNRYVLLDYEPPIDVDVYDPHSYGWGRDFYIDVCRNIDEQAVISGLTFYLVNRAPAVLPTIGRDVVLIVLADETYRHRSYVHQLLATFRCLPARPVYLDGIPVSALTGAALLHYVYKSTQYWIGIIDTLRSGRLPRLAACRRVTFDVPLGIFSSVRIPDKPILSRIYDFGFLGSTTYADSQKRWFHKLLRSPKEVSRKQMLSAIESISHQTSWVSALRPTSDFSQSINNKDEYATVMAETKVAIVPRGTCYDTYRYFEAMQAGCIVVREVLPTKWFYTDSPALGITRWSSLKMLLESILNNPDRTVELQHRTRDHYASMCSESAVGQRMSEVLLRRLRELASSQTRG